LATPNYGYEKRQRELAKRLKKEEKLKSKADRKHGEPGESADGGDMAPSPQDSGGDSTSPQAGGTSA
jgi:hypothetical protein